MSAYESLLHISSTLITFAVIVIISSSSGKIIPISVGNPEVEVVANAATNKTFIVLKFPKNFSKTDNIHILIKSLHNKSIVFVGDSLTRYQYLNLAYFAVHQRWPPHFDPLCREIVFDRKGQSRAPPEQESEGWKKFNEYSNSILNNLELCECYREKRWWLHKDSIIENRFLSVPHIGLNIFYIAWNGNRHTRGHFNVSQRSGFVRQSCMPSNCSHHASSSYWVRTPEDFLRDFLLTQGDVDLVVINSGLHIGARLVSSKPWGRTRAIGLNHSIHFIRLQQSLLLSDKKNPTDKDTTQKKKVTRFVWKTTSPHLNRWPLYHINDSLALELESKEKIWDVFDLDSVISRLYSRARELRLLTSDPSSSSSSSSPTALQKGSESFQFHWDKLHPHCWVLTEANKVFLQSVLLQEQPVSPSST